MSVAAADPLLTSLAAAEIAEAPVPVAGRRASLAAPDFRATVVEHLVHTCAKDPRDASALDLYHALAHTVRDRLVHRWLATQRTHFEQDVKRACYLSSEFLTGRSLGLCLMNMGVYEVAERIAADAGFDLGAIISAIFDNPIFKLFEGIFGGGKKLEPVSAPPPQGQPLAQDAGGALFGARAGASAREDLHGEERFDSNDALTNGFSLADLDDLDNTGSGDVANLAHLEGDK